VLTLLQVSSFYLEPPYASGGGHGVVRWPRAGRVDWDMIFLGKHHTAEQRCLKDARGAD
jgi:hypothetical protein